MLAVAPEMGQENGAVGATAAMYSRTGQPATNGDGLVQQQKEQLGPSKYGSWQGYGSLASVSEDGRESCKDTHPALSVSQPLGNEGACGALRGFSGTGVVLTPRGRRGSSGITSLLTGFVVLAFPCVGCDIVQGRGASLLTAEGLVAVRSG